MESSYFKELMAKMSTQINLVKLDYIVVMKILKHAHVILQEKEFDK